MNQTNQTSDQLNRFRADGFVAFRSFVSGDELGELIENVDRFIANIAPRLPAEQVFYEDKNDLASLKQIQRMGEHDDWFHKLFTDSRFREVAEYLLQGPVVPKNLQYFNKPPRIGQPTPPHQDGFYFMLDPCEALTMWFALDHTDRENGCVCYVRGSHRQKMREHARTQTLGFSQGITDYPNSFDAENEIVLPAQPGDLLVHHALTVHRAFGNQSAERQRRALGFIYYSQRATENVEAHKAYQRKLVTEMQADGSI